MTKPIRSYPEADRVKVALRRVKAATMGIGYLSAVAFLKRMGIKF